ncbi:MAG: methyl-accepting chemotaxis protein [Clostridium butyricum]|nr:methyl-accepting chemotaxis protein [Clostridium butyricum]
MGKIKEYYLYLSRRRNKKKSNDLSIKYKLLKSFYIISILGCISGTIGLILIHITTNQYNNALINYGMVQGDIGKLGIEIEKSNSALRDFLFLKNEDRDEARKELNCALENIEKNIEIIEKYVNDDGDDLKIEDIKKSLANYKLIRNAVSSSIVGNRQEEGLKTFREYGTPLMNSISEKISGLLQNKIDKSNLLIQRLNYLKIINSILIIFITVCTFIFCSVIAKKTSGELCKNITLIKNAVEEMEKGNLDVDIQINAKDEIGILSKKFLDMNHRLKAYISEISIILGNISEGNLKRYPKENYKGDFLKIKKSLDNIINSLSEVFIGISSSSNIVNLNSLQLSDDAQLISLRSIEESKSVNKLTEYINVIHEKIQNNEDNANKTNEITQVLIEEIEENNRNMKDMLIAMKNIKSANNDIQCLIYSINEISSQIDLLAINASIEAARVGKEGDGFAVVAEEIRCLSAKSSNAVKQSEFLMKKCFDAVKNGEKLAFNTDESLNKLIKNIKVATTFISKINISSTEQSKSISRIYDDIVKISCAIKENSISAEKSAESSQQLYSQSETLNSIIGKFEIK